MSEFIRFKEAVRQQMETLSGLQLFRVDIDKNLLYDTYLQSFRPEDNPVFRERTEHDCQCCKQFILAAGGIVAIGTEGLISIWDVAVPNTPYQVVADALAKLVKSKPIKDVLLHPEKNLGTDHNHQLAVDDDTAVASTITWSHFHFPLPDRFVKRGEDIGTTLSNTRSGKEVFERALHEISIEAVETVIELIEQKSIYRGEEHLSVVQLFLKHRKAFSKLPFSQYDNYCWENSVKLGNAAKIRNSAIGTLLIDVSDGMELDAAVRKFEAMVAPTNYKRPTALITKSMIDKAQKKVEELGIAESLQRRFAVVEDITANNVLFADRSAKKAMNVFDEMADQVPDKTSKFDKVDEVDIGTFVKDILPKASSIELLVENAHSNNFMSLIAPMEPDAKQIFKWDNNFSWAYSGEVADSIKERVKRAGGNVEGVLRCSLSWFNTDDLDIHVVEPDGNEICYSTPQAILSGGTLDVDMNVRAIEASRSAVENIVWADKSRMHEGTYKVFIHNYTPRETVDIGFDVEIEHAGVIHTFHYDKRVQGNVTVAKFAFSKETGITFIESLPSTQASKEIWGIPTQKFHKVSLIMNSPNHWDGRTTGNKHLFFILDGCRNDKKARGFFNEFLKAELNEHRKVFEVLGSKTKAEVSDRQLSGLGFSSTQKNQITCKVTGSFNRVIKINF